MAIEVRRGAHGESLTFQPGQTIPIKFRIGRDPSITERIVGPDGATVKIDGFASVDIAANSFMQLTPITLAKTADAVTRNEFIETSLLAYSIRADHELRISTGFVGPSEDIVVELTVPSELLAQANAIRQPRVWVQIVSANDLELHDAFEVQPTMARSLNTIRSVVPARAFTNLRTDDGMFEAVIILALGPVSEPEEFNSYVSDPVNACKLGPLGPAIDPKTVSSAFNPPAHKGTDYVANRGDLVMAAREGVVEKIGWDSRHLPRADRRSGLSVKGWGRYVLLRHDDNSSTLYAHLIESSTSHLTVGDVIEKGGKVGAANSTGGSTGDHLHFEYRGPDNLPVDPEDCMLQAPVDFSGEWAGYISGSVIHYGRLYTFSTDWRWILTQQGATVRGYWWSEGGASTNFTGMVNGSIMSFAISWQGYVFVGTATRLPRAPTMNVAVTARYPFVDSEFPMSGTIYSGSNPGPLPSLRGLICEGIQRSGLTSCSVVR